MSRKYLVTARNAAMATPAANCPLALNAAATVRPMIYEFIFGARTSNDAVISFSIARLSNTPVGTTVTMVEAPIDTADPAALSTALSGSHTGNTTFTTTAPTFGNVLLPVSLHQRATFRWVANDGKEFKCSASATDGFAIQIDATAAFNADMAIYWEE